MNVLVMLGMSLLSGIFCAERAAATPAKVAAYSDTTNELTEAQKVERLLAYLRGLEGAVFIRNGSEHSNTEAAKHLQAKWEKHKDKIGSAVEFIEKLASASGLTGEDYTIRLPDGTVLTTREVLMQELKRLDQVQ